MFLAALFLHIICEIFLPNPMFEKIHNDLSKEHMDMVINVLKKYNIDINDQNTLDLLIHEAEISKIKCAPFQKLKINLSTLGTAFIYNLPSIVSIILTLKIKGEILFNIIKLIVYTVIISLITFCLVVFIIKVLFFSDHIKYDQFIEDIRQIKIFHSKKSKK